jgi:hypothetical protein
MENCEKKDYFCNVNTEPVASKIRNLVYSKRNTKIFNSLILQFEASSYIFAIRILFYATAG